MAKAHILGLTFITSGLHPDHDEYARGGDLYPNSGYISLIKVIREVTGLGLKETKDAVDNCRDFGQKISFPASHWNKVYEVMLQYNIYNTFSIEEDAHSPYTPESPESAFGNVGGPVVREWLKTTGYKWDDKSFSVIPLDEV